MKKSHIGDRSAESSVRDIIDEIDGLISEANNIKELIQAGSETIVQTSQTLTALNSIKVELYKLSMDPGEKAFVENSITPLLGILNDLSNVSYNLSGSVNILTTSPITPRKKGKLKDTLHMVYSINEECQDIYDVLKRRLKKLNKEAQDNCPTL